MSGAVGLPSVTFVGSADRLRGGARCADVCPRRRQHRDDILEGYVGELDVRRRTPTELRNGRHAANSRRSVCGWLETHCIRGISASEPRRRSNPKIVHADCWWSVLIRPGAVGVPDGVRIPTAVAGVR